MHIAKIYIINNPISPSLIETLISLHCDAQLDSYIYIFSMISSRDNRNRLWLGQERGKERWRGRKVFSRSMSKSLFVWGIKVFTSCNMFSYIYYDFMIKGSRPISQFISYAAHMCVRFSCKSASISLSVKFLFLLPLSIRRSTLLAHLKPQHSSAMMMPTVAQSKGAKIY